jgi:hypothetical protein
VGEVKVSALQEVVILLLEHHRVLLFAHPESSQQSSSLFSSQTIYIHNPFLISYTPHATMAIIFFGLEISNFTVLLAIGLIICFRHRIISFLSFIGDIIKWIMCIAFGLLVVHAAVNAPNFPQILQSQRSTAQTKEPRGVPWQESCFGQRPFQPSRAVRRRHRRQERQRQWKEEERRKFDEFYRRHQEASAKSESSRFWEEARGHNFWQEYHENNSWQEEEEDTSWKEEPKHNFHNHRRQQQQSASAPASTTTAFLKWRENCRAQLQTPNLITTMPRPPYLPCSNIGCNTQPSYLKVCSHGLRKLYQDSRLGEKDLKDELRLWHPNGAKVNQVREGCKMQVLGMANEIAYVLQEILKGM